MRLLKILIALPVVVYGLVMGYLWLHVKSNADDMVKAAAGFATIEYDSVHISPLGDEVGLNDIIIKPNMSNDEFRIEKVRLSAPHIGYFIQADSAFNKGSMPEKLGVNIQRIHVDLNSEIFSMLEQMQQQTAAQQNAGPGSMLEELDSLGCGDRNTLTLADYRRMGVGAIVADASIDLGFNKVTNRATIQAHIKTDQLYSINLTAGLDASQGRFNPTEASGPIPDMKIAYTDTGIYKLRNRYCASLNQGDVESYVNRHIQLVGEQLGAALPEPFLQAYKDYMLNGGTIGVNLTPVSGINIDGLKYYPPDEVMNMLGLTLAVNGKKLDNKQIRWLGTNNQPRPGKGATKKSLPATKSATARPKPNRPRDSSITYRSTPSFHKADVYHAEKHINRLVEVTLYNGRVRKGILDKVNEGRLYLVIEIHGGSLSYPVKISDVQDLRVRY